MLPEDDAYSKKWLKDVPCFLHLTRTQCCLTSWTYPAAGSRCSLGQKTLQQQAVDNTSMPQMLQAWLTLGLVMLLHQNHLTRSRLVGIHLDNRSCATMLAAASHLIRLAGCLTDNQREQWMTTCPSVSYCLLLTLRALLTIWNQLDAPTAAPASSTVQLPPRPDPTDPRAVDDQRMAKCEALFEDGYRLCLRLGHQGWFIVTTLNDMLDQYHVYTYSRCLSSALFPEAPPHPSSPLPSDCPLYKDDTIDPVLMDGPLEDDQPDARTFFYSTG
ncbi:hypothetical protein DM01DRAFT_1385015 [Hesseltinella vesiculosa]|uniref:Uncharacterized protein n=1 Tax=Hesseltinella vesiculosa TaxID=101127 RepID=A0A1X2GBH2_9FUNG|nr:hypothetical protein DM01DRAFT_1385015 [Hesseltinella vesiculosa]